MAAFADSAEGELFHVSVVSPLPSDGVDEVFVLPENALSAAGGEVQTHGVFEPHVVQDREFITGQNPYSDGPFAELLVQTLDRAVAQYRHSS